VTSRHLCAIALLAVPAFAVGVARAEPVVVAKIAVGSRPCATIGAFGSAWVTNYGSSSMSRIDPSTNAVTRTIKVGFQPCGLAAGAGSLWVDGYGTGTIVRVDPKRLRVVKRIRTGSDPYDVTYAFGSAWSSDHIEGRVSRISPKRNKVVRRIRVAPAPAGFAVTANAVWVGSANSSFVTRIDPRTNRAVRIDTGVATSAWLAASSDTVWAGGADAVVRIDATTNRVVARVPVPGKAADGSVASDGKVWFPLLLENRVVEIDPATNEVVSSFAVGDGPFVLNEAFGDLWVGSWRGSDVWRLGEGRG
jgi:YVTN family beta-propeller protein